MRASGSPASLKKAVVDYYGRRALWYDEIAKKLASDSRNRTWLADVFGLVAMLRVPQQGAILDVGTGTAAVPMILLRKYDNIVGLDITKPMLSKASINLRSVTYQRPSLVNGDTEALPFIDSVFNGVTCLRAFHHFSHPKRVAREMYRVIIPGGQLVLGSIILPDDAEDAALVDRLFRALNANYNRYMTLTEYEALMNSVGFGGLSYKKMPRHMEIEALVSSWSDRTEESSEGTVGLGEKASKILNNASSRTAQRLAISETAFDLEYSVMSWTR